MSSEPDYKALAGPWAARIAEAYRTADGDPLDAADRKSLAAHVLEGITLSLILHIPGDQWGYMQINPKIGVWENGMRLRRGFRLLTVDEGRGTLTMGNDPRAR